MVGYSKIYGEALLFKTWSQTVSALLAICEGILMITGGFPSQRASNKELWCFVCC